MTTEVQEANNKTTFSHTTQFHTRIVVAAEEVTLHLVSQLDTSDVFAKTRPGIISLSMSEEMKVGPQ